MFLRLEREAEWGQPYPIFRFRCSQRKKILIEHLTGSIRMRQWSAIRFLAGVAGILGASLLGAQSARSQIAFVQVNSATPQSDTVASVTVSFSAAQTAGNLNVVVVGWNDTTASVLSVTDSSNNGYVRAAGPTLGAGLSK